MCIICKFGGSSVADAERMRRIAEIIRGDPERRYIVLSAPGKRCTDDEKITDLLYRSVAGGKIHRSIFSRIFQRYAQIRDALAPDFDLEAEFDSLLTHDPADADYFVSRGEYLCAKVFAAYTGFPFIDAADLLTFDERGQINRVASSLACGNRLLPMERAVIPGFYGRAADGSLRLFNRGGSDVSGAWIAALTHAKLYENWTDVNGLYSADPAIVNAPTHHPLIGFAEAEAILRAGAHVLHPDSLPPLRCSGIDCVICNSFSPDSADTRISQSADREVFCVTGRRNLYMHMPREGCEPVLYTKPVPDGVSVAAIAVFGLNAAQIERMRREIEPIHTIHMQEHVEIIVPNENYVETVRRIHEIFTQ